jgi:hypothetical protein
MSKKRVTRTTVTTDKDGNKVTTSVTTKQGGCLAWALGIFLAFALVAWPIAFIHGWIRWLVAAGWWLFLLALAAIGLARRNK